MQTAEMVGMVVKYPGLETIIPHYYGEKIYQQWEDSRGLPFWARDFVVACRMRCGAEMPCELSSVART